MFLKELLCARAHARQAVIGNKHSVLGISTLCGLTHLMDLILTPSLRICIIVPILKMG